MDELSNIIESNFENSVIDFQNAQWTIDIPSTPGWYFIETDTPVGVFRSLPHPSLEYVNNKNEIKKCRNYNLTKRINILENAFNVRDLFIIKEGVRAIYSGKTKNLKARAREHTFGHKGTAGLALVNYKEIYDFKWYFRYRENPFDFNTKEHLDIILKFGEQIWRSKNGWPILCSG